LTGNIDDFMATQGSFRGNRRDYSHAARTNGGAPPLEHWEGDRNRAWRARTAADPPRCSMHSHQDAQPRHLGLAAAVALLLAVTAGHAASQSETQPPPAQPNAAAQAVQAIAGPASMTVAPPAAGPPKAAAPVRRAAADREMTADERHNFMMVLILRETARNPIGSLR
jgi:hypothetical protein